MYPFTLTRALFNKYNVDNETFDVSIYINRALFGTDTKTFDVSNHYN